MNVARNDRSVQTLRSRLDDPKTLTPLSSSWTPNPPHPWPSISHSVPAYPIGCRPSASPNFSTHRTIPDQSARAPEPISTAFPHRLGSAYGVSGGPIVYLVIPNAIYLSQTASRPDGERLACCTVVLGIAFVAKPTLRSECVGVYEVLC